MLQQILGLEDWAGGEVYSPLLTAESVVDSVAGSDEPPASLDFDLLSSLGSEVELGASDDETAA